MTEWRAEGTIVVEAVQPGDVAEGSGLRSRFRSWLTPPADDFAVREYYTKGTVVLDSSVLLNLY